MEGQGGGALAPKEINVAELVADLRALYFCSGVQLMLRIGELILTRMYQGDEAAWHAKHRKDHSFRKLQAHPDLPFAAATLSRAVSLYALSRRRPDLLRLRHVSASHLQEVLRLAPTAQDQLLERVEREHWSVKRLRDAVRCESSAAEAPTEPRPFSPTIHQVRQLSAALERAELVVSEALDELSDSEAADLLDRLRRVNEQAQGLANAIRGRRPELEHGSELEHASETEGY